MDKDSPSETTGTKLIKYRSIDYNTRHLGFAKAFAARRELSKYFAEKARFRFSSVPPWVRGLWNYQRGPTYRANSVYLNEKINSRLNCLKTT
jgi:hypothetical protein